jgi:hypothetical protein
VHIPRPCFTSRLAGVRVTGASAASGRRATGMVAGDATPVQPPAILAWPVTVAGNTSNCPRRPDLPGYSDTLGPSARHLERGRSAGPRWATDVAAQPAWPLEVI